MENSLKNLGFEKTAAPSVAYKALTWPLKKTVSYAKKN